MKKFTIQDREAGNKIETFATLKEAQDRLKEFERKDKRENIFSPDFYEIVEETTYENLVINPAKEKPKEHFLIGSSDMPAMAVIYANANTVEKLICEAVSENLDAEKVKVVKISDFNHKAFQQEAKVKITQDDETNEEIIYLTPISIYK